MADQLALELFQTCMSLAHCFLPKYANEFVQPAADSVRAYQDLDSKGKSVSLETLISSIFDLMGSLATTRDQIRSFLGTPSNNGDSKLISLIIVLIGYSSISQVQEITWEESVGEVICEENEASFAFSVRKRALELILTLQETLDSDVTLGLLRASSRCLENPGSGWKTFESCFYLISAMFSDYIDFDQGGSSIKGRQEENVLLQLVNLAIQYSTTATSSPVLLQGRAMLFLAKFEPLLTVDQVAELAGECAEKLDTYQGVDLSKTFAIIALNKLASEGAGKLLPSSGIVCPRGISGLVRTLESSEADELNQDIVGEILACMLSLAAILDADVVVNVQPVVTALLLRIWGAFSFASDVYISGYLIELAEVFAKNPVCKAAFEAKMLPCLSDLLSASFVAITEENTEVASRHQHVLFDSLVVPFDHISLMTPNGQEFLANLISRDFPSLISWNDPADSSKSGLDYIIQLVAKMLEPSMAENGAIFIGELITKLITCSGGALTPVLPDLLKAVALRLDTAKNASFIQTLVLVFAQLVAREQYPLDTIISFLAHLELPYVEVQGNHQLAIARNGLEMLLNVWCENHSSFVGYYECKVSAVGLAKLVFKRDPRLSQVNVRGDIIITEKIMTRSRARKGIMLIMLMLAAPDQYTSVCFPVKVIKLLLADFSGYLSNPQAFSKEDALAESEDDGDEDDFSDVGEWEDAEEGKVDFAGFTAGELTTFGKMASKTGTGRDGQSEDPDVLQDPVYSYDMSEYLATFFKTIFLQNNEGLAELCRRDLNQAEQEALFKIL
ncbi:MAG: hypothetical protein SGCHY_004636 [Lobulomycetales sp.]